MRIRIKLWVEHDEHVLFGEGRMQLLEAVARTGSLAGAAREMNMSYRAAWGRIKASEERLGFPLVERGDKGRRSMHLSAEAQRIMELYTELCRRSEEFVGQSEETWREALKIQE